MSTEHLTPEQRYELGFEIVSGMHASAYNQDIERGRMETKAGTELPTPEELATEGLTEIPDYCYKSVEWEKNRLNNQIDFIMGVVLDKLVSMDLSLVSAQQVEQQTKQLREERDKSKQLLERWLNVRERQMKGDPTMLSMESIQIETRDFLKHLNQDNEG